MDLNQYVKDALKTESPSTEALLERIQQNDIIRMLHAAIGLQTEVGEIQDALKKHIFYGKPLDKVNLIEEMGDLFWYLAILADTLGVSFEHIMQINIAKLKARYGENFTSDKALNRDLNKEYQVLSSTLKA
jgi:NTP pyrophosphatase (non-canonical NTP hydrolase)